MKMYTLELEFNIKQLTVFRRKVVFVWWGIKTIYKITIGDTGYRLTWITQLISRTESLFQPRHVTSFQLRPSTTYMVRI